MSSAENFTRVLSVKYIYVLYFAAVYSVCSGTTLLIHVHKVNTASWELDNFEKKKKSQNPCP